MQEGNTEISIDLVVPPSLAYDACVNPQLLRKWMFTRADTSIVEVTLTSQVGGGFSIIEQDTNGADRTEYEGKYITLTRPHELTFSLRAPKRFEGDTTITISIPPTTKGCTLSLSQPDATKGLARHSWEQMLEQLRMSLEVQ